MSEVQASDKEIKGTGLVTKLNNSVATLLKFLKGNEPSNIDLNPNDISLEKIVEEFENVCKEIEMTFVTAGLLHKLNNPENESRQIYPYTSEIYFKSLRDNFEQYIEELENLSLQYKDIMNEG